MIGIRTNDLILDREASLAAAHTLSEDEKNEWFDSITKLFQTNRRLIWYPELDSQCDGFPVFCLKSDKKKRRVFVVLNPKTFQAIVISDKVLAGNEHHLTNHAKTIKEGIDRLTTVFSLSSRLLPSTVAQAASAAMPQPPPPSFKDDSEDFETSLVLLENRARGLITPQLIIEAFKLLDTARQNHVPARVIHIIAGIVCSPNTKLWLTRSSKTLFLNYQLGKRPVAQVELTNIKCKDYLFVLFEGLKQIFNEQNRDYHRYLLFLLGSIQAHPAFIEEEISTANLDVLKWSRSFLEQLVPRFQDPSCYPLLYSILERYELWSYLSTEMGQMLIDVPVEKDVIPLLPFLTSRKVEEVLKRHPEQLLTILKALKGRFFCEKLEACAKGESNDEAMKLLKDEYDKSSREEKECYQITIDRLGHFLRGTLFETLLTPEEFTPSSSVQISSTVVAAASTTAAPITASSVEITNASLIHPFQEIQKAFLDRKICMKKLTKIHNQAFTTILKLLKNSSQFTDEQHSLLQRLLAKKYDLHGIPPNVILIPITLFSLGIESRRLDLLIEIVRYFQRQGKEAFLKEHYEQALFTAAQSGSLIGVQFCLSLGFSPAQMDPSSGLNLLYVTCCNLMNHSPEIILSIVRLLIQGGAPVNQQTQIIGGVRTSLSIALIRGLKDVVKELLEHGADPNILNPNILIRNGSYSSLDIAASQEDHRSIKLLLKHGALPLNGPIEILIKIFDNTILSMIAPSQILLKKIEAFGREFKEICEGKGGNLADFRKRACGAPYFMSFSGLNNGFSLFHMAVYNDKVDIVRELMDVDGISPDHQVVFDEDEFKTSPFKDHFPKSFAPLHICGVGGYLEMARCLLTFGATVDIEDERGWTPLFYACKYGNIRVINFLLENGANLRHRANGQGVLDIIPNDSPLKESIEKTLLIENPQALVER